jgi:hypothetical protein
MRLFRTILCAACLASVATGQTPATPEIPVVTVCDVLNDLAKYKDKSLIMVGRTTGTIEGQWLSADCEKKLVTDGFTWSDSISLTFIVDKTDPPPHLPDQFTWDMKVVAVKLKEVQRTTRLRGDREGWLAIFGRFETRVPPIVVRRAGGELMGYGFGHLAGSPAQLIWDHDNPNVRKSLR